MAPLGEDIFRGPHCTPPLPEHLDHPVHQEHIFPHSSRPGLPRRFNAQPASVPQTNKFYAGFLLGDQGCATWTHPYVISWAKGQGNAKSWGLAISHSERHMLALGPKKPITGAVQYFLNPIGIQHLVLSANELQGGARLTVDNLQASSVNVNLSKPGSSTPVITFPLLQGMGFVTAAYLSAQPLVQSSVFFRSFTSAGQVTEASAKYRAMLEDGTNWLIYTTPPIPLSLLNNTTISGAPGFNGVIQVAKAPTAAAEAVYDASAGAFPSTCTYTASMVDHGILQYGYSWHKEGALSKPLLMFALPHHIDSFDHSTATAATPALRLQTTTKGLATAVLADTWTMIEHTPPDLLFAPYHLERGSITSLSSNALAFIHQAAQAEVNQEFSCNLGSMYFSGKALAKYAMLVYAVHDLARNPKLAAVGLDKLKRQFAIFVENKQSPPLVYNPTWRTIVSTAGLSGDAGADFGNSYCNDHHFHYGYHVYTAAVIAYLDPAWLRQGVNKMYVDALVRDFAAPVNDDLLPFSRAFDWYHGHSWAKGLFASGDGKDQESTSEDAFASYAVKMWGKVSGDAYMDARGSLMLAVQARSFRHYFLMESDNRIQPPEFIGNKVAGILFENKIDHATYFGANIEYIQGIHMIPLSPVSPITRSRKFGEKSSLLVLIAGANGRDAVKEEWETYFSNGRANEAGGGWRGLIYANLALIDPRTAFAFFSQPNFDPGWLDGGASRTWYLAWMAALGGA